MVQKPSTSATLGYVFLFPCVTPIPPPAVTLKPASAPLLSMIAIKPTSFAKMSTSFVGGTATAILYCEASDVNHSKVLQGDRAD